jgi:glycerol-3-phosphate acyltransferase PlsY
MTPFGWPAAAGLLFGCYLVGSIPFGYFAGRLNRIDIRKHGSGNIGATNVFRVLGKKWGTAVFILDFLKAALPLLWIQSSPCWHEGPLSNDLLAVLAALAILLGHTYTVFLGFKGGKGVASSAGVLLALMPWGFLAAAVLWGGLFAATRVVSVASLAAAVVLPFVVFFAYPGQPAFIVFAFVVAGLVIWRHRTNIQRLRDGSELGFKKKQSRD